MSHSGKDLLQILETYPRDELFQMTVDELLPIAASVMHLQERRQVRLFLRYDVYGRFASAMVYLPRDRYTTQVRLAMESILLEAFGGRERRLHRTGLRVGARAAALRRARHGRQGDPPGRRRAARGPAHAGDPHLGRRPRRRAARAARRG